MLKLKQKEKGLQPLINLLVRFQPKDKCVIVPNPRYKGTLPDRRMFGKIGVVRAKMNKTYQIFVADKLINTTAAHMKAFKDQR